MRWVAISVGASIAASMDSLLTPAACRTLEGMPSRLWSSNHAAQGVYERCTVNALRDVPPDPWSKVHIDGITRVGEVMHSAEEVFTLLRGKRVAFIGDSVTEQLFAALHCFAHALPGPNAGPGAIPTVVDIEVKRLHHGCMRLWHALEAGRNLTCTCGITALDLWATWSRTQCALSALGTVGQAQRQRYPRISSASPRAQVRKWHTTPSGILTLLSKASTSQLTMSPHFSGRVTRGSASATRRVLSLTPVQSNQSQAVNLLCRIPSSAHIRTVTVSARTRLHSHIIAHPDLLADDAMQCLHDA